MIDDVYHLFFMGFCEHHCIRFGILINNHDESILEKSFLGIKWETYGRKLDEDF